MHTPDDGRDVTSLLHLVLTGPPLGTQVGKSSATMEVAHHMALVIAGTPVVAETSTKALLYAPVLHKGHVEAVAIALQRVACDALQYPSRVA